MWKGEVTTSRKVKIFNISLNGAHFSKHFSYTVLYLLVQYTVKSHDFLISCFESGHFFQEMQLFGKIHFVIFFLNKIRLLAGQNGKKWPKMTKNNVCHGPYLTKHTSYLHLWYTCVKGEYLQEASTFFKNFNFQGQ